MRRLDYAIKELEDHSPYDGNTLKKIMDGRRGLVEHIKDCCFSDEADEEADGMNADVLTMILDGMDSYIKGLYTVPAFKQKRWKEFVGWVYFLEPDVTKEELDDLIKENLHEPVKQSTAVEMVKALQAEDASKGKTKKELKDALGVSIKTVHNTLYTLDPTFDDVDDDGITNGIKKNKSEPFRFAGQMLNVDIERETFVEKPYGYDEDAGLESRKNVSVQRYYCPESCNPIAMQLNVYQVGALLKGLQMAYDADVSFNSFFVAVNIWSQLSEYCQERLKSKYHPEDWDFHEFLDLLSDENCEEKFTNEIEILSDENESVGSKLNLAFKGSRRCNIQLHEDDKVIRDCMVTYDHEKKRYLINTKETQIEADEDEIKDIFLYSDY